MDQNRFKFYTSRSGEIAAQIARRRGRSRGYVAGEIASFLAMAACLAAITLTEEGMLRWAWGLMAAVCLVGYIVVRQRDACNDSATARLEDLKQTYDHELCALKGDFSCFDDGQRYVDPHHAYTFDLDVFGKDSLYQRMARLVTTGGSDALARRLGSLDRPEIAAGKTAEEASEGGDASAVSVPIEVDDVRYRERIDRLADDEAWRSEFMAYGVSQKIDTDAIIRALDAARAVPCPRWFGNRAVWLLAVVDIVAFVSAVVLAIADQVNGMLPLWWGMLQFFMVYAACSRTLREVSKAVGTLNSQLKQLVGVIHHLRRASIPSFDRLQRLLDGLDRRGNIMGLMLIDTFALYDFFLVRRFLCWVAGDADEVGEWISRVITADQDVTIATWRYNHPQTTWAEVHDGDGVTVEARGLYHPFLGDTAIRNDFTIDDRNFYIVTGANMAGKSTFLRSVGVNYIMAMTGIPVFADHLSVSRFCLFSSMRTTDDLAHGISYFNAELLRLQQLMTYCRRRRHTLIILDEILKGTNSLDKLNGSRLFLQTISQMPVSGIIATHDLELSKMEGARFHNYCFEIALGTDVTYSYKITPGVAQNQNATFLLKKMIEQNAHNPKPNSQLVAG